MAQQLAPIGLDPKLFRRIEQKATASNIDIITLIHLYLNYATIHHDDVIKIEEAIMKSKQS